MAFFVSCTSHSSDSQTPSVNVSQIDTTLSDNHLPIFDDADGKMDSLYKVNGYVCDAALQLASEQGDVDARRLLASMYAYGIGGVKPDRKKTYILYRSLAEDGDAEAQAYVGYMLLYGLGPVEDLEMGIQWLQKSANQHCPVAFYYLGKYFEQTDDMENAYTCYKNAVALGFRLAQDDIVRIWGK